MVRTNQGRSGTWGDLELRSRDQGTALFLFWWIQGTKLKLDKIIFIGATAMADKTRKKSVKICCKVARKERGAHGERPCNRREKEQEGSRVP